MVVHPVQDLIPCTKPRRQAVNRSLAFSELSYRVNHGRKWVSKLSQILSKETLQFVSLTHLTQRGVGGRRSPPNLPAWLRKVCYTFESPKLLLDTALIIRTIFVPHFLPFHT